MKMLALTLKGARPLLLTAFCLALFACTAQDTPAPTQDTPDTAEVAPAAPDTAQAADTTGAPTDSIG